MRFIHCADIHLDSPLRGLERYEGAPVELIRGATRGAFTSLITRCLEEAVDFLLIAGDLYDGDRRDFNTALYFCKQMSRLREWEIPVFLIRGNHDAESRITRDLPLPDNVYLFPANGPSTQVIERLRVAVHGQSFATPAVTENLVAAYPDRRDAYFNIGLLHTSLDGRPGHAPYAPCTTADLKAKGYDYWALGHVHTREIVCQDPWMVFPGNLQGRHIRETGSKGYTLVTASNDGAVEDVRHCSVDVVRWHEIDVDGDGAVSVDEIVHRAREAIAQVSAAADGRIIAARLIVGGCCAAHDEIATRPWQFEAQIRGVANDAAVDSVWIADLVVDTSPTYDLGAIRDRDDPVGELARLIQELGDSPEAREEIDREFLALRSSLPSELHQDMVPEREEAWDALLRDVERTLIPRVMKS